MPCQTVLSLATHRSLATGFLSGVRLRNRQQEKRCGRLSLFKNCQHAML